MKITIFNGNPHPQNTHFDNYQNALLKLFASDSQLVKIFKLREMNIQYCTGCFDCWVKTPGECIHNDDSREICREYINSDFVLFASPIIMGFTSSLIKKVQDKLVPLVHPYFEFAGNEVHHLARYDKYPRTGLLLEKNNSTDDEDIKIISEIFKRNSINARAPFCFTKFTTDAVEEILNEIISP